MSCLRQRADQLDYVRNAHPVSFEHFLARAHQTGSFHEVEALTIDMLHQTLHSHVEEVDFEQAKSDVRPFLTNVEAPGIRSKIIN